MKPLIKLFACLLAAWLPTTALALDFRSVAVPKAVLFDAPSAQARKLFVVSRYYPVEIIVNLGEWIKVRDMSGDLAWIEAGNLADQRTVVVTVDMADVHALPDPASKLLFRVSKDVALELLDAGDGNWAKVRYENGTVGYILSSEVWGA